jgi:hypothetical protein
MNSKKGFFTFTFFGYFSWILEITQGEKAYVKQK